MCLTNNRYPRPSVSFSKTILLGLEILDGSEVEHVVGYCNKVMTASPSASPTTTSGRGLRGSRPVSPSRRGSRSTAPSLGLLVPRRRGPVTQPVDFDWNTPAPTSAVTSGIVVGNAMLIAIPATPGSVTSANLIPVGKYPTFMQDYANAVATPIYGSAGMRRGGTLRSMSVEIVRGFDNGTYDVLIAPNAKAIVKAIEMVDPAKRPQVNAELYKTLDKLYPRWTFLLFCFSEDTADKAGCALVRYKPMAEFKHLLYLPGLDGHNGEVEQGKVELDHTLVVGSYKMSRTANTSSVTFSDRGVTQAMPFLPSQVIGKVVPAGTRVSQGDFLLNLADVRQGNFRAKRALPPGWQKVFAAPATPQDFIEK